MVETVTANYGWTKPEVTKSASTWGGFLNGDLDSIDALVFANQQGIVPIGGIQMFGGTAAPANWLLCDGASLVRVAPYDKLFAIIGTAFGAVDASHFNVPNLAGQFPMGVAGSNPLGQIGGTHSYTLAVAHLPAHAHPIADVPHNHTINQNTHSHVDAGHIHFADQPPHSHTVANAGLGSGVNIQPGSGFNMVNTATTSSAQPGVNIYTGNASIQPSSITISLNASGTGLSNTQNTGSGSPLIVVPKYVALTFIIRFT